MKHLPFFHHLAAAGISLCCASAATGATLSGEWTVNQTVPDSSILGLSDTRTLTSEIYFITGLTVTLNIDGGWVGDLFAYVRHDSGYAVLLNRIGRTSASLLGYSAPGLQVSLSDSAFSDIHTAGNSAFPLAGIFQPDGRIADPDTVLNSSPRSALLDSFNGLHASGDWTLFVADIAGGDEVTVRSWGLEITGVPEPETAALSSAGILLLIVRRTRFRV